MKKNTYLKGLKFGMLLQFAVGPMCLMVFNTAQNSGFILAFVLVIAIALVDAFYISLAGIGADKLLSKDKIKKAVSIIGSVVLVIFGLNFILNVFGINIIPGLNVEVTSKNIFIQGLILTLSNPVTIIFWGSILTTKIIEEKMKRKDILFFSIGLVSSTLIFLTSVALIGTAISTFIPDIISKILNVTVGIVIIFFGTKMLLKKK